MKESITQEDNMGCGAACVAFIGERTYREAAKVLGQTKAKTTGYHLKELVVALEQFGVPSHFKHIKLNARPISYQQGLIVFIKRSAKYPYGHYLARHNDAWMDPWINLPRNKSIEDARSGYRKRLPGKVQYALFPGDKPTRTKGAALSPEGIQDQTS